MKKLLSLTFLLFSIVCSSQVSMEMPESLEVGIRKGEAAIVARYFNDNLEMSINGEDKIYSAKQAEYVLQRFFRAHKPESFYVSHQGGKTKTSYIIGDLKTNDGNFKLILLLKKHNNVVKIHQLRIEND